jgi:hypothetical protein
MVDFLEKMELAFSQYRTKRKNPCDTCPLANTCDLDETDCFAFRRWTNEGDYKDRQVGRLIREFDRWD